MTFTIGGQQFYSLVAYVAAKQYALKFEASPAKYQRSSYHPVGVNGSYTVAGNKMERTITCTGRFIEATDLALSAVISAFRDTIEDTPIVVIGPDEINYNRCFVQSMRKVLEPRHCSAGVYADVEFVFTQYGSES